DPLDGWVYGPSLFATHDGGRSWEAVDLGGAVMSLATSGGVVDAVVVPCSEPATCGGAPRLEQAQTTGNDFRTVVSSSGTAEGMQQDDLELHAPVGFVLLGSNQLYATSDLASGSRWNPFPDPCASPSTLAGIAVPDTVNLYSVCTGSGGLGSSEKTVMVTRNGQSSVAGSPPSIGDVEGIAATGTGTLVVSSASGSSWLFRSTDSGHSWSMGQTYNDGGAGFVDLGFTTASQGIVIHGLPGQSQTSGQLLITTDGGATWKPVTIG
ncbi:MAG: WD40/YVTN/BNR-like repeat-containing protein, partial [Acidimicrobiales bacterium]